MREASIPASTAVERVHSRQAFEAIALQRVEADGKPPQTRALQVVDRVLEQDAVGGERQVPNPGLLGERGDECRKVAAEQGFAACQPEPIDAQLAEQIRKLAGLFEG